MDWSNIIAACIGVIGTFVGAVYGGKQTLRASQQVFKEQEEKEQKKKEEDQEMMINVITKILRTEIIHNNEVLNKSGIYDYCIKNYGVQLGISGISNNFITEVYDKIKFDLLKYSNVKIISDVVDIYECFDIIRTYDDLNKMTEKDFKKIQNLKSEIDSILKNIDLS